MTVMERISPAHAVARLTARDFWLLADAGAFRDYARTELIEGEILVVNSVWRWHAHAMAIVTAELFAQIREHQLALRVMSAGSVDLDDHSVPEPYVSIIAPGPNDGRAIARGELRIAIEISDTTAAFDRGRKLRLYARNGVPEYWVVDRDAGAVIRHAAPVGERFTQVEEFPFGTAVASVTLPQIILATDALLTL